MRHYRYLMLPAVAVVLFGCGTTSENEPQAENPRNRVNAYATRLEGDNTYPAFRTALVHRDGVVYQAGFGAKDTTSFYAYSTAKIVTSLAVLQLAGKGRLSLDDPLSTYLDYVPWQVTLRQVMSHSSGIPNPVIGSFYIHYPEQHTSFDSEAVIRSVIEKNSKLLFEPGTSVSYSNLGYALLGLVIEQVTGTPYPEYVRGAIFDPLDIPYGQASFDPFSVGDLSGSFISRNPFTRLLLRLTIKGSAFTRAGRWTALRREYYFDFPSHGGLIISSGAFSTFLKAVLNRDHRVLGPEYFRKWFTVQARGEARSFALGWEVEEQNGVTLYSHAGGAIGESARIAVYPEASAATVYLTNLLDSKRLLKKDVHVIEPDLLAIEPEQG